jgi:uncharacterized protein YmfQ (DUF2313 family)
MDRHVRRSGSDYAQALLALLPQGQAWPREPGSELVMTVDGVADYWGTVDGRAGDLLEIESDPRATLELLPDWCRNWQIPDPCLRQDLSTAEKRLALVAKMTLLGGQSRQFFIDLGAAIGYTITIREYAPFMTGVSRCGDTTDIDAEAGGDGKHCRWEIGPPEIRYYWSITVYSKIYIPFRVGQSQTGIDRLLKIGLASDLECIFNRYKPAHTIIVFDYTPLSGLDFSESFNNQYLALEIV